ncbi:spore germination protein [Paenibacillus glycanilyticus]|uniref:spore germination protein n=1 Tax=Paenibacillus glycanilyticus TaxID=126569 RepID=UPI0035A24FBC
MRRLRIRSSGKAFNILKSKSSILQEDYDKSFGSDLEQNESYIKETFQNCYDLEYRRIKAHHQLQWIVVYIDSLIDKPMLEEHVLKPLLRHSAENDFPEIAEELADQWISIGTTAYSDRVSEVIRNLLQGHAAILTAGSSSVITVAIPGIAKKKPRRTFLRTRYPRFQGGLYRAAVNQSGSGPRETQNFETKDGKRYAGRAVPYANRHDVS